MKNYLDASIEEIEELKEGLLKLLHVWELYPEIMDEEINHIMNVITQCNDFIQYKPLVNTQSDIDTFGEFSRRTERAYQEINKIIEGL
jgi:hypothetical protein